MRIIRKAASIVLIITLVASMWMMSAQAVTSPPTGHVTGSGVNLRSGAGTSYSVVTTMAKNTKGDLLSCKLYNSSWYYIKLSSGKKGYVSKSYFKIDSNQLYIASAKTCYKGYTESYTNFLNTTGKTATWTSSDTSVATVDSKGKITSKKTGSVTITVKAGSKSVKSTVTVVNATVKLNKTSLTTYTDSSATTLKASCAKSVTWTSSKTSVATVSSKGAVTPKAVGTTTIKAASKSGSATCTVTVKKRTLSMSATKTTMYVGNYAIITPSGGSSYSYSSDKTSVLTVNSKGIVKAVATGTATVTLKSGSSKVTKKFTVKSGSSINLSNTVSTVYATKTLYLKSRTSGVKWKTSTKAVATVNNGYVYGVKKGYAVISAYTSSGSKDCLVTVNAPEAVRFAYTSENSVPLNSTVKLYAITDTSRVAVKFKLTSPSGKVKWVTKPSKSKASGRITWTASTKMTEAGVYNIAAHSHTSATTKYNCSPGGKTSFYVNSSSNRATTSYGEKRATTALLNNIASFEGFLSKVAPDELVADSPTVGYGKVVYAGDTFYNGMTKAEAFAYLTKTVNESGFTSRVNKLLKDNKIKFNQAHFDALVDFSYNLGAYAIENDSDFMSMLKGTYGKASNKLKGYVRVTKATVRKSASDSAAAVKTLLASADVTLVSTTVYNGSWYKIKCGTGEGYIKTSQVARRTTSTTVRDLHNVDYKKLKSNILPYHHASGSCYWGLLYRRIDEVEMFFYRDYSVDGRNNDYKMKYYCSRTSGFGVG